MEHFNKMHNEMGAGEKKHEAGGGHGGGGGHGHGGGGRGGRGWGWGGGWGYPYWGWGYIPDAWGNNDIVIDPKTGKVLKKTITYSADGTTTNTTTMNDKTKIVLTGAGVGAVAGFIYASFAKKDQSKCAGVGAVLGAIAYYFMKQN
jgi:hypothetical protein